jgi:hypothetical protein
MKMRWEIMVKAIGISLNLVSIEMIKINTLIIRLPTKY